MKRIAAGMVCILAMAAMILFLLGADAAMRLDTPTPYIPPSMIFTFLPFATPTPAPSHIPFNPNATPTPTPTNHHHWLPTPTPTDHQTVTTPSRVPQYTNPPADVAGTGQNICSMGLYFRELRPQLTDKWYFFTPIELNKDGVQTYKLILSNAYEAGELTLTIENGQLTAVYRVPEGITVLDEFLTFFPNLSSVATIDVQSLQDQEFPFNEPIDIHASFGEDLRVILYMNNAVSASPDLGLKAFDVETWRPWMWQIVSRLD